MAEFCNILVFKHMPSQNPGIFRQFARHKNITFDEIDLHAGESIPELERYDGLWVMGGTMNVWEEEEFPWLIEEKAAIRKAVNELNMPFLGICLGHQLLADALGGEVSRYSNFEIGAFTIEATEQGNKHPFMSGLCQDIPWINVHTAEVSRPPDTATVLARSTLCANHAMSVGSNAYSVQFHPEVCENTLAGWLAIPGIESFMCDLLGKKRFSRFKSEVKTHLKTTACAARHLLNNWLSLVQRP